MHAMSYAKLRELSTEKLIELYDKTAQSSVVGLDFLRNEIAIREAAAQTMRIVKMTNQMRDLTIAIAVLTVINIICAAILLLR